MLRTAVVIDYQNVHLTARDVFLPNQPEHEALIHPMQFSEAALHQRNSRQREGYPEAELRRVVAYRGHPHADYDPQQHARCSAQADQWRRDGVDVYLRDLKYKYQHGADGWPIKDINGHKVAVGSGKEKGVDVMCALACVRFSLDPAIDLVVLASRDSDLVPVLDEVHDLHSANPAIAAKIETVSWDDPDAARRFGSLRPTKPRKLWNTNLDRRVLQASLDRNDYR